MANFNNSLEVRGAKTIVALTGTLGQVLKQLDGLYGTKMQECDGMTVGEWFANMGVNRSQSVDRNGNIRMGKITPGTLREGWNSYMVQDGKMCMYQSVYAVYTEGENKYDVYDQAAVDTYKEKGEVGSPVKRWTLREVDFDGKGWSIRKVINALRQGRHIERNSKRMEKELNAWKSMGKVYIAKTTEQGLEFVEVDKTAVEFLGSSK